MNVVDSYSLLGVKNCLNGTVVSHKHIFVIFHIKGPCPILNVSYKPQKISPKSQGTVRQLLHDRIREAYIHPQFVSDVMKPLMIENIIDQEVI